MASQESRERLDGEDQNPLPDYYGTVAEDLLAFCGSSGGRVWVDLGSGAGGIGLALAERVLGGTMVLMDPNADALGRSLSDAERRGLASRVVPVVGSVEKMPLPDACIDPQFGKENASHGK